MISLIILSFFSLNIYSTGFSGKTLLLTDQGQIAFDQLNSKTLIQESKIAFQPIVFFQKQSVEQIIQLTVADEIITCHPKQLFWCVNKSSWECAENLVSGDLLQTVDEKQVVIDTVELVQQQTEIYSLTVGPPHYLYVGKYAILAHNVVPFVLVATAPLTSTIAVKVASTVACTGLVALGGCIANFFAKNNNKKKPRLAVVAQPVGSSSAFFNPNDDKNDKEKHPHGIYEDADYHGLTQNGRKSPRPKDGQKALDNSYAFGEELSGRIAIQDGEFVVLRSHNPGKYHGYRCQWEKLPDEARAILQKFNLVNKRGKIF